MSTKGKNVVVYGNSHGGGGGEASGRSGLDLQYREFLENFRESSYSLVLKLDDDLEIEYRYEPETCSRTQESSKKHANKGNSEPRRNPRGDIGSETCKNPKKRRLSSSEVREEAEMENLEFEYRYEQETCSKIQQSFKKHANRGNSEARRNPRCDIGSETRKNPKKRRLNSSEVREEAEVEENDPEWEEFLKNLRNEGGELVYKKTRYYEEDESSSSDVMILSPEEVPRDFVTSKPSFVIDLDGDDCPVDNGDCEFRRKLIEELKMPFDAEQYQMFFQEVNIRRRKTSEKMLRGRDVPFTTRIICESYLERYPDFAEKINSAEGDKPRILNLLRGFVFWLRNSVTVGSFRPWLDPSCLKILPELKDNACHKFEDSEVM